MGTAERLFEGGEERCVRVCVSCLLFKVIHVCPMQSFAAAEKERDDLQLEVERLQLVVEQLQAEGRKSEEENRSLLRSLQRVQGRCQEKIKVAWNGGATERCFSV